MPNYTTYNIKMVKGDTESFGFEVTGIDSLDTAFFSCKRNSQDTEYVFQKGLGYGITQDENNCFAVRIAPADTKDLDPGQYWYDLEIGVNGDVFTIFRGVLELLPQITQSISPRADATWGYITGNIDNQIDLQSELDAKANISSLSTVATSGSYTDLTNTPNLAVVATSGSYNDLSNTPNLATVATTGAYSDLTGTPNLAAVATSGSYNDLSNTPNLATVATSGSYADLSNTPNLATVATTGSYADLSNTPNLAAVATSGSYNDLIDKPSVPGLASVIDAVYPVGSYYWNANSTSPATLFGVGTWTQITNQFIFAAGGDYASGDTGGEATHTLTIAEIPNHNHRLCDSEGYSVYGDIQTSTGPASGEGFGKSTYRLFTARTGGGGAHNNMPPYLVAYCWRRDS